MHGAVRRCASAAAAVAFATSAALLTPLLLAAGVRAADEAPFTLPRATAAAVTADLDGDGARELVRIAEARVPRPDPALDMVVEVWSHGPGGWMLAGTAPLGRPAAEGNGFVSVDALTDGFGLLVWHEAGQEHALVVTGGSSRSVCCLIVLDVALGPAGLSLRPLDGVVVEAEAVATIDMESDGTDELIVTEPALPPAGIRHVTVLRWDGEAFRGEQIEIGGDDFGGVPAVGETDGVPGHEAVFGPRGDGSLLRLAAGVVADTLHVETHAGFGSRQPEGFSWVAGAGGGLVVTQQPGMISTWSWPRGQEATPAAEMVVPETSHVGVLSAANEVLLVETGGGVLIGGLGEATTRVHRTGMAPLELAPTPAAAELMDLNRTEFEAFMQIRFGVYPYVGPIPTGLGDGVAGYVSMGNLITVADSGELEVDRIGALVGGYPIGAAGPGGSWMAMTRGYIPGGSPVYLFAHGGFFGATVTLVPTSAVMAVEDESVVQMSPSASGSGPWGDDGAERTFVRRDGLAVTVSGPIGSSVTAVVDSSVVHEEVLDGPRTQITLAPARERETDQPYQAAIMVLTPSGQTYLERWDLVILRQPPALSVEDQTLVGELAASVSGRTSSHAILTVDGTPVQVRDDGRFDLRVEAAPWPRDILVVARDAVGNETAALVGVVGLVDYRGLPWVAMVAAVTILAGLWLFMRTPGYRREPATLTDGARLEELDSDVEPTRSTEQRTG